MLAKTSVYLGKIILLRRGLAMRKILKSLLTPPQLRGKNVNYLNSHYRWEVYFTDQIFPTAKTMIQTGFYKEDYVMRSMDYLISFELDDSA